MRQVSYDNIVQVVQVIKYKDSNHILEISKFMPLIVVDVCLKSFTAFQEFALAAIIRQASGRDSQ